MTRDLIQRVLCATLRLFYRRVEVAGQEHLAGPGPVLFVLNHPNALIDPLVLLCRAGRPVSFLAKEPLFRMPLVGTLVRAMDSIPVWRRMDQADTSKNRGTFDAARRVLARGGTIGLFPEGRSTDAPRLLPFRTGAARIALGAAGAGGLRIVPAGLFYTRKDVFRSAVLLVFGLPIPVTAVPPGEDGEPPAAPVRALTRRLEDALAELTIQADRHRAHRLIGAAEEVLTTGAPDSRPDLATRFQIRQRLSQGYARLQRESPEELERVERRLARYHATLSALGLTPALVPLTGYRAGGVLAFTLRSLLVLLILLPLALLGLAIHLPGFLLIRFLSRRWAGGAPDARASVKAVAGMVVYPLTWFLLVLGLWLPAGPPGAVLGLALGLPTGLAALFFLERLQTLLGGARGVFLALTGRRRFLRLIAERRAIGDELRELAQRWEM